MAKSSSVSEVEALLGPVPGGWTEQLVALSQGQFKLTLPADPNLFLDVLQPLEGADSNLALVDPFWARLWPIAQQFASDLGHFELPTQGRVLELGCGIGLCGLAALGMGFPVTFSDYIPKAVELALFNARQNGFQGAEGLVLDWRNPPPQQFDIILGCEILYDHTLHEALLTATERLLTPGGCCLLADPGRHSSEHFLKTTLPRGVSRRVLDSAGKPLDNFRSSFFQVVELRKKSER